MKTAKITSALIGFKTICLLAVVLVALNWPGFFNQKNYKANFHWPEDEAVSLKAHFKTWDGAHYLFVADKGYQPHNMSSNFFPLWPFLIRAGKCLFSGNSLVSALILANSISLGAMLLFYFLALQLKGEQIAAGSLLFLSIFPGSIFYLFPYAESIFLFCALLFFIFLFQKKYGPAAFAAFLLTLSRPVGVCVFLPIVYELAQCLRAKEKINLKHLALFLSAPLGALAYLYIMYTQTGNPWAYFEVQKMYSANRSLANFYDLGGMLKGYLHVKSMHGIFDSFLDRLFFTVFLFSLPAIWRLDKRFFWFALPLGVLPVITGGSFMSYSRCLSIIFPFFIVVAQFFQEPKRRFLYKLVVALLATEFFAFLIYHSNAYWAG